MTGVIEERDGWLARGTKHRDRLFYIYRTSEKKKKKKRRGGDTVPYDFDVWHTSPSTPTLPTASQPTVRPVTVRDSCIYIM